MNPIEIASSIDTDAILFLCMVNYPEQTTFFILAYKLQKGLLKTLR